MTCATCGNCGFKTAGPAPEVMVFCHCQAGVNKRLYSNRMAINAYRDAGSEPITKPQHYCAMCGLELLPGQPCGGWCKACVTQDAKAKLEFKREDWRITWAAIISFIAGLACMGLMWVGFGS